MIPELTAAVNQAWCHWSVFSGLRQDIDHGVECWDYLNMFLRRGQSVAARVFSGEMFFNVLLPLSLCRPPAEGRAQIKDVYHHAWT